jgi:hypothetical protein
VIEIGAAQAVAARVAERMEMTQRDFMCLEI